MRTRTLIVLAAIAVCAAAGVVFLAMRRMADGRVTPTGGTILLEAYCNGSTRLFAINPDGSDLRPVLWDWWCNVAVSPDGKHFATLSEGRIYVHSATGKRRLRVTGDLTSTPTFSPDSRMVGTISHRGDNTEFVIESVDGSSRHRFSVRHGSGLAFSPDGRHVAFSAAGQWWDYRIFIADLDGRNRRFLAMGDSPVFSPDGGTVAFNSKRGKKGDLIYLIDVDGRNERLLTRQNSRAFYPVFSPNGAKIAFRGEENRPNIGLYLIDSDGRNQRKLSRGPLTAGATFSPDGGTIAYSNDYGVFLAPVNGGRQSLVTRRGGGDLYWGRMPPLPPLRRPSFAGLPRNYYVDQLIDADLDGDGRREQACTAGRATPPYVILAEGDPKPLLVLVARGNRLIARFEHRAKDGIGNLKAVDLTGDGVPELTYNAVLYGGSDHTIDFHARQWTGQGFRNTVGTTKGRLSHLTEGGVVAVSNGPHKPSTLVLYDFIWGYSEAHCSPHRYWAEWYELKNDRFVRTTRKETKRKYGGQNPLTEFGIKVPSPAATPL